MEPNSPEIIESEEVEILRVRRARHQISERFGHDPHRLVTHLLERQDAFLGRQVSSSKTMTGETGEEAR